MFEKTTCWDTNVATTAIMLIISVAFAVDALRRQVPMLIAKARAFVVASTILRVLIEMHVEQNDIAHSVPSSIVI